METASVLHVHSEIRAGALRRGPVVPGCVDTLRRGMEPLAHASVSAPCDIIQRKEPDLRSLGRSQLTRASPTSLCTPCLGSYWTRRSLSSLGFPCSELEIHYSCHRVGNRTSLSHGGLGRCPRWPCSQGPHRGSALGRALNSRAEKTCGGGGCDIPQMWVGSVPGGLQNKGISVTAELRALHLHPTPITDSTVLFPSVV